MKRHLLLLLIVIFFITGCVKESSTSYYAYMVNATSHTIEIRPFFHGQMQMDRVIKIGFNATAQIASGHHPGIVNQTGFISDKLTGADSIQVVYDDRLIVSHYLDTPIPGARRYYLNGPPRNVFNVNSYAYEYKDLSKHGREAKYTYTFTEQDYQYAQ